MDECKDKLKALSDNEKILQCNAELNKHNKTLLDQLEVAKENFSKEKNKKWSQKLTEQLVERLQQK